MHELRHDRIAVRRVLAGHLANLYAAIIDADTFCRNVRALSDYGTDVGDDELAVMAAELVVQIQEGELPILILPEVGVSVAPDPESPFAQQAIAAAVEEGAEVEEIAAALEDGNTVAREMLEEEAEARLERLKQEAAAAFDLAEEADARLAEAQGDGDPTPIEEAAAPAEVADVPPPAAE